MRVAALYDVHGNLPALEAVLDDQRLESVDRVVCGGDLIAGPMPVECLDRLERIGATFVRGNGDRGVVDALASGAAAETPSGFAAARLGADQAARVRGWPLSTSLEIDGLGWVLFCHATPRSDEAILTRMTPDGDVIEELGGVGAEVVVHGHVHVASERLLSSGLRVVNAGSVGAPYEGDGAARWALLGPTVELVRTPYDVEAALGAIAATGYPEPAWIEAALRGAVSAEAATAELEARRPS